MSTDGMRFRKIINACSRGMLFDLDKVEALSPEDKVFSVRFLARMRQAILEQFISGLDKDMMSWLASMGYLYRVASKRTGFRFLATGDIAAQWKS